MSQYFKEFQKARFIRAFFYCALAFLCGCHSLSSRMDAAGEIIASANLQTRTLETSSLPLFSAYNSARADSHITIVIEGDGYAWANRYAPSDNPTPVDPVGLKIASSLQRPAVYLARPCQYILASQCQPGLWSYDRFSPDVINSFMNALDQMQQAQGIRSFDVVGFSGGAYIAISLAARRQDIKQVTTIAGVLDPGAWTTYHDISPLRLAEPLDHLLQSSRSTSFLHICSHDDDIAPCSLTERFIGNTRTLGLSNHAIEVFADESHETLWERVFGQVN